MTVPVAVPDRAEGAAARPAAEAQRPGSVSRRLPPASPVPVSAVEVAA